MRFMTRVRRTSTIVAALAVAVATGCADAGTEPGDHEEEPDVAAIAISAGTSSVVINSGQQAGSFSLRANQDNLVTVRFLRADGSTDPVIDEHSDEYEVRFMLGGAQAGTNVFVSTNADHPYTGTIRPTGSSTVAVYDVVLYSKGHGHVELSWPLAAQITP